MDCDFGFLTVQLFFKKKGTKNLKILITGAKGQLASELEDIIIKEKYKDPFLKNKYKNCECLTLSSKDLDITDFEKAKEIIVTNKPDALINCAALTNVDYCESNAELALKVNALGAKNLAVICDFLKTKLVHISTDYVFKGDDDKPYSEWDICNPETVYGKSKLLGEQYVREFTNKYFIIRTSWLYSKYGNNFVKAVLNLSKTKGEISIVNDQLGNPTNATDLAIHILNLTVTNNYGLYHCTGEGTCSWYDFARKIIEFSRSSCKVIPTSTEEYQKIDFRAANRPKNSALNNLMLKALGQNNMRPWEEALKDFIGSLK